MSVECAMLAPPSWTGLVIVLVVASWFVLAALVPIAMRRLRTGGDPSFQRRHRLGLPDLSGSHHGHLDTPCRRCVTAGAAENDPQKPGPKLPQLNRFLAQARDSSHILLDYQHY